MTILDEFGSIDANKVRTMTGSDLSVEGQGNGYINLFDRSI